MDKKAEFEKKIKTHRNEIDKIDQQILSLVGKRQSEVAKVVALKKEHNVPVYHPAREEDLISKLRIQAGNAGLDPDFMEDLYRIIIRYSRVTQTGQMSKKGLKPGARILIVGGEGQMGRYFTNIFLNAGYIVSILSENDWGIADKLCQDIELALISVPIEITEQAIEKIAPHLPETAVLADITSIKKSPLNAMLTAHKGPVVGLHPLFGPTTASLDKQIIVITPGREDEKCQWLIDQFSIWGAITILSNADEHDEIMEVVQALRHFATFSFGEFLSKKGIELKRTLEFSSPIYRLELGMVGRLFAQDAPLYAQIIFSTPQRRKLLKEYILSLNSHLEMLENNDRSLFIEKFDKIAEWFGPFSEQALRESTFLINKLIDRF